MLECLSENAVIVTVEVKRECWYFKKDFMS